MTEIESYEHSYYRPPAFKGLEKLVRFPDGEVKRRGIANSTIWIFDAAGHQYVPEILGNDAGCGMAAFLIKDEVDPKESADRIYKELNGKNILGRGNHFVDICSPVFSAFEELGLQSHYVLLLHTDGKQMDKNLPQSVKEAKEKVASAERFREDLGHELLTAIGTSGSMLGNWTHNSVEDNGHVVYRKGVVKVTPGKVHVLPASLGEMLWFYTIDNSKLPPHSSMPHATGRSGPRGEKKVSVEEAARLREAVYIPPGISDTSLRTEHPSCYNDFSKIIDNLKEYIFSVGTSNILSYVGKI